MFSFFAWVSLISGIVSLILGAMSDSLSIAVALFVSSLINFAVLNKLSRMDGTIEDLESRVNSLSAGIGRIRNECGKPNIDLEKETRRVDEIKQQIDSERSAKYQQHIKFIENKLFAGKCPKKELLEMILAPKEWEETSSDPASHGLLCISITATCSPSCSARKCTRMSSSRSARRRTV